MTITLAQFRQYAGIPTDHDYISSVVWRSDETEPEFIELDEVLLKVAPNISFLLYRKLCRELVTNDSNKPESYISKSISIEALYKFLCDNPGWNLSCI